MCWMQPIQQKFAIHIIRRNMGTLCHHKALCILQDCSYWSLLGSSDLLWVRYVFFMDSKCAAQNGSCSK